MEQTIKSHLEGIKFGAVQRHRNMAVCPVFSAVDGGPHYMTMKEALAGGFLLGHRGERGGRGAGAQGRQQRLHGRAHPGRGGTGRGQAEPHRQHDDPASAPVRDDHPRELHRAGALVLRVGSLRRLGPHRDPPGAGGGQAERDRPPSRPAGGFTPTRGPSGTTSRPCSRTAASPPPRGP